VTLARDSGVPLYRQIQDYIREKIETKEWVTGDQIPTENQLEQQFGVSRITVVKALNRLVEEGLLRREQGRGTFVTGAGLVPKPLTLRSFTEEMRERGKQPGSRIVEKTIIEPSPLLRDRLSLSPDQRVYRIVRLLTANGEPMGLHRTHLPVHRFPRLLEYLENNRSLYETLRTHYGIEPDRGIETYSAVQLDPEECSLLAIPEGSPAFVVARQTFASDIPFEFVTALMRSDEFHYTVQLYRKI